MKLAELVHPFNIPTQPGERWLILGPEAATFAPLLPGRATLLSHPSEVTLPPELPFDGLLLAGAMSAEPDAWGGLEPVISRLREGAALVVIDWQADGLLDYGPDLELRFKRGRLSRLLREVGFRRPQVIADRSRYYVIRAVKERPQPQPHAGEFVAVATVDELLKNTMKKVELFGHHLVVANTGREIVAFAQTCPHAGAALDQGKLRGRKIICSRHGYIWNVCTGEPIEPADEDILPRYPVKVEHGHIWVALAP